MTSVTIILSLPTIISGYYGMNVRLPFENSPNAFMYIILISIIVMMIIAVFFKKRDWF
ncbi:MAG: hypothetical protein J7L66_04310 [Anaerolineaceae bacterium]|nr:hypothetical protein [Anaerolineaceae bacterium]